MMTPTVYEQEYNCAFTVVEGQVYPDLESAVVETLPEGLT